MAEIATSAQTSELEPVPVGDCRICWAAANGRTTARNRRNYNEIISQHPHRRTTDRTGLER
ncbi:hypothetical protein OG709_30180 [Streptomyces sp. NBC_01267]|uniref:hypothetical protein n=1 Tax=Streptomyces sp. NBC_01267 TaxID=2903805 RepID=UPI002E350E2B|nr:hypothetical protein [Streptomyces sp. NBC_01267]